MFELPMTASRPDKIPAIVFNQFYEQANFHNKLLSILRSLSERNSHVSSLVRKRRPVPGSRVIITPHIPSD
jgi:hypothetical protein